MQQECGGLYLAGEACMSLRSPSGSLRGRAAALHLKGHDCEYLIIVSYLPPRVLLPVKKYRVLLTAWRKWVEEQIEGVGGRATPIVMGDFNGGFGIKEGAGDSIHCC